MKKSLLLGVMAVGAIFTSCSMGGASLKTDKDSVSYAIGTEVGGMAMGFDSTLNVDAVVAGVRDAFAKNAKMTPEQCQSTIQLYMQKLQVDKIKEAAVKFTADSTKNVEATAKYLDEKSKEAGYKKTESGILYKIEKAGSEPKVQVGDSLSVNYELTLPDGTKVDSSYDRNAPMDFINVVGGPTTQGMIAGFVEGMTLFGKGGKGTIIIPAEMAYGARGNGPVGPCQAVTFDVEILDIMKPVAKK